MNKQKKTNSLGVKFLVINLLSIPSKPAVFIKQILKIDTLIVYILDIQKTKHEKELVTLHHSKDNVNAMDIFWSA